MLSTRFVGTLLFIATFNAFAGTVDSDYQVSDMAYNLRDVSKSGTEVVLGDEEVSGPVPIGFAFNFYGDFYTAAYISSNGFVTFNPGSSPGCCSGMPIPTPGGVDNMVAGFWEDLNPLNGGTIRYQTFGTPPNREFVVGFYGIEHFRGNTPVEMEMILHEGTGVVELQYTTATTSGESNHSVGVESEAGQFGTQVDFGSKFSYTEEGRLLTPGGDGDTDNAIARFAVEKFFDDDNPAEVGVSIQCNTGLPLQQTTTIAQGDGVVFVVRDFNDGELNCSISETQAPEGYLSFYSADGGFTFPSAESCDYEEVTFGEANSCVIENELERVLVEVTKWWVDDNPQFSGVNYARATYDCVNEQFGAQAFGTLEFAGNGAVDGFFLFPHWDGTTSCDVTETTVDSGIESDDSDCRGLVVTPGSGASCSLINTRIYEGIPAIGRNGLALLVMLMLGIGLVTYRRLV